MCVFWKSKWQKKILDHYYILKILSTSKKKWMNGVNSKNFYFIHIHWRMVNKKKFVTNNEKKSSSKLVFKKWNSKENKIESKVLTMNLSLFNHIMKKKKIHFKWKNWNENRIIQLNHCHFIAHLFILVFYLIHPFIHSFMQKSFLSNTYSVDWIRRFDKKKLNFK